MKNAENIVDRGEKTQVLTAIRINRLVIKIIRKQIYRAHQKKWIRKTSLMWENTSQESQRKAEGINIGSLTSWATKK